jgi:hypothetical protein
MSHPLAIVTETASGSCFRLDSQVPTGRGFIALLKAFRATGGTVPGEILGRLLEEHQVGTTVSLAKRIHTGQVFGFEWRADLWIPMFQFNIDDLSLKADVQLLRAELPSMWSGWTLASWFAKSNVRLSGHSPVDMIDSDLDDVVRAAHSLESSDAIAHDALAYNSPLHFSTSDLRGDRRLPSHSTTR